MRKPSTKTEKFAGRRPLSHPMDAQGLSLQLVKFLNFYSNFAQWVVEFTEKELVREFEKSQAQQYRLWRV